MRSDIDDEHNFAVKLFEIIRLAILVERFQIVKSRCRGHDKSTRRVAKKKRRGWRVDMVKGDDAEGGTWNKCFGNKGAAKAD